MNSILSALTVFALLICSSIVSLSCDYLTKLGIHDAHQEGYRGQGQTIAIIDDPFAADPVLSHVRKCFVAGNRSIFNQNLFCNVAIPSNIDVTDHGTHVAGIIAAKEGQIPLNGQLFQHVGITPEASVLHFSYSETWAFRVLESQARNDDVKALVKAGYDVSKLLPEQQERLTKVIRNFLENMHAFEKAEDTIGDMESVLIDILREIEKSDVSIINLSRVIVSTIAKTVKGRSVLSNRLTCALRDVLTKGRGRLLVVAAGNMGVSLGDKYHIHGYDADIVAEVFLEGQLAKIYDLKDYIIFVGALSNDEQENVSKAYANNSDNLKTMNAIHRFKDILKGSHNIKELAEIIYEEKDIFKKCWPHSMETCESKMMNTVEYTKLDSKSSTYEKSVKSLYISMVCSLMAEHIFEAYQLDSSVVLDPLQKIYDSIKQESNDFYVRFVRQGESSYQLASFSNKAGCAFKNFISTYGEDILSTLGNQNYALANGTSMAAPIVTGCLALLLQANPKLTPPQAWQILRDMADAPFANPEVHGVGALNFNEALKKARFLYDN